jgi:hypothetical protein
MYYGPHQFFSFGETSHFGNNKKEILVTSTKGFLIKKWHNIVVTLQRFLKIFHI